MEVNLVNKLPSTLTKNQAIAYAVVAFNNFINSGNTSDFDIVLNLSRAHFFAKSDII